MGHSQTIPLPARLLALLLIGFFCWGAAALAFGAPASRVELIRLGGGDWGYPSPYAHYPRGPGGFKMCLIFDSLLERGEKGLIPWLATAWQVGSGGKTYIFTLRPGVHWHDGMPLTPEDVVFSLDYAARHPMTWSQVFDAIQSTEILDGGRVKVTLKHPSAPMLYRLGTTRILPRHIWEKVDRPKQFTTAQAVIGTGPYRLTAYSREHGTYRFEASPNFWGPPVRVKRLEFIPAGQPVLAYEQGEIDMIRVSADLLGRYQNDPEHRVVQSPGFWGYRLLFNRSRKGPLQSLKVRQAFAHAIDRQELVAKIARGAALPGRAAILPPDHVMATENARSYAFDPKAAAALLDQAGCAQAKDSTHRTDTNGAPLAFDLLCSGQEVRMAEIIRQRLAAVGISIRIRSRDGKTRDSRVRKGEYTLAIIGHGGWGNDPEYLALHCTGISALSTAPSASGGTGAVSAELRSLLDRQTQETDPEKRCRLVKQAQQLAAEEVPELPLFYTTGYTVFRPGRYDGWMFMFDHHSLEHSKLSYLDWKGWE